jgi:hypothetical protein
MAETGFQLALTECRRRENSFVIAAAMFDGSQHSADPVFGVGRDQPGDSAHLEVKFNVIRKIGLSGGRFRPVSSFSFEFRV